MNIHILGAAVLAIAVAATAADPVHASCESKYRVHEDDTPCFEGEWDNTEWNTKTQGAVHNLCAGRYIPKMKVKIDLRNRSDINIYLTQDKWAKGYGKMSGYTRGQYCCHDYGPCWKNEVKGPDITWRVIGDRSDTGEVRIDTCREADEFCEDDKMNTKTWFCKKKSLYEEYCGVRNCGDRYCDVGDCKWAFSQSQAAEHCRLGLAWWKNGEKHCKFHAFCLPANLMGERHGVYHKKPWDINDLVNCDGRLQDEDEECDQLVTHNCDDHFCTVDDCNEKFLESDAATTCTVANMTYNGDQLSYPKCSFDATCTSSELVGSTVNFTFTTTSLTDVNMESMEDVSNCNGTARISCGPR